MDGTPQIGKHEATPESLAAALILLGEAHISLVLHGDEAWFAGGGFPTDPAIRAAVGNHKKELAALLDDRRPWPEDDAISADAIEAGQEVFDREIQGARYFGEPTDPGSPNWLVAMGRALEAELRMKRGDG